MSRYPTPDKECIEQGSKFLFVIDRKSNQHRCGDILDGTGTALWRYSRPPDRAPFARGDSHNKPDFTVTDLKSQEMCVIRRTSLIPSRFEILQSEMNIGTISATNILRNRYRIDATGVDSWTFRLTLFTVFFWGDSKGAPQVWVRVGPSKMEWSTLIKPGVRTTPLVFALAFIHNQWWNYS